MVNSREAGARVQGHGDELGERRQGQSGDLRGL